MNRSTHARQAEKHGLLSTKLIPPRLPSALVSRDGLLARLDGGLDRKLTLISAPPGFGKTTLVSAWLAARQSGEHPLSAAWVSLDTGDNDPVRFWRYVLTACRACGEGLGRSALAALRAAQPPAFETTLTSFINELAQLPQHYVLVLEDYHAITTPAIHTALTFLIDHLPPTLHIVLMSRGEPPLPLARWRVRGEVNDIAARDLRFSSTEIEAFLRQTVRMPVSSEALARLEQKTEGWAAGLRLVSLALQNQTEPQSAEQILVTFSGGQRPVLEYVVDEVLAAQSEARQMFLLQTSGLDQLTGSLCDVVLDRTDSALLLEQLERANLFLIPLGDTGGQPWYRYHTLFAEALRHAARQRFSDTAVRDWHEKASQWYEAHRMFDQAIEAASLAQAWPRVAALIEWSLEARGNYELHTLLRWIGPLPKDLLHAHPALCFAQAQAILFTSDRFAFNTAALVEVPLQAAELAWRAAHNGEGLGQVLALRSVVLLWHEDLIHAFAYAREALEHLPEHETNWRGTSLITVGIEEWFAGQLHTAQRTLLEARALSEAAQNTYAAMAARILLGEVSVGQGEIDRATEIFQQALIAIGGSDRMQDDRMQAEVGLARAAFERNDLIAAEEHAARAIEIGQQFSAEELEMRAAMLLARVRLARGETASAQEQLRILSARLKRPRLLREVQAWQARFALAAGDLATAQRWQTTYAPSDDKVPPINQELEAFTLARLQLAEGRPDSALELLGPWRVDAHEQGRTLSELESLCLMALAYSEQANLSQARKLLMRALTIAQPLNCQRVFLDEGKPLAELLHGLMPDLSKRPLITFAMKLLKSFASTRSTQPASEAASPLLEPLSAQELRVLKLLAAGLSNPEIARELIVSPNTIKTQVKSIFNKLNVNNRAEAAEVARELNLL